MKLEARDLAVRLGETSILERIDLSFEPGESVAIIGPNGAGKSTLLRSLAGLLEYSGEALLDGRSLSDLSRREIAKILAFVSQSRVPAFDFTVLEFVLMGMNARKSRFALESADEREMALDALRRVDLEGAVDRGVQTLSGGEYQRCVLARTLLTETSVWLLDEPTSELDPKYQLATHELIRRDSSILTVTVLHDLHQAARFYERIILLVDGQVAADGTPEQVLVRETLESAYGVEIERVETEWGPAFVPVQS